MAITAEAPRGGVVEYIGNASYTFVLRNREIERFEDKHRGIFDLWEGFFERGKKPTSTEVRDLLALALVVFAALVLLGYALQWLFDRVRFRLYRFMPPRTANVAGFILTAAAV